MIDPYTGKRGPSLRAVNDKMKEARRMYAAGNYRRAAKLVRDAFLAAQHIRAWEAQQYAERMKLTLDTMEEINGLTKALVEKHREGKDAAGKE